MSMIKKILAAGLIAPLVFLVAPPTKISLAYSYAPVWISAPSAVLVDGNTHQLVFAKTPHVRRPPASTTKILTAMVAMDLLSLDTAVTIPGYVASIQPSKIYLRGGERYRIRDLIRAILISSANDAAEALAVAAAGSRSNFALIMNQKAWQIGCRHSHFVNPSGLPNPYQYSTAYDLALIMRAAQWYPFLVETLKVKTMVIQSLAGRRIFLRNHNKMLWRDHREVLGKTGWTRAARHCFVGLINMNNRKVFVAMLGSHRLWRDLKTLVNYQFGTALSPILKNRKIWSREGTRKIQLALHRAGFNPGPVDGRFGTSTVRAVQSFQRAYGLPSDGIVGPVTWQKLSMFSS
jgi:D-alanyl-D-alanine carboxypeptidase (penicillin-binding protein 5/6)